ncbi:MAG: tetratricopeptide repeat protein [bacterium]
MIQQKADIERIYNHIKALEARYRKNIDSRLFFPLADAYVKADMLDQAEVILREGLCNHPKYCAAKALLGEVLFKKGDLHDAQIQLEEVIEIVPDNIMAHKLLIEIYKRTGLKERYERELMTLKIIYHEERPYSGRIQIEKRVSAAWEERSRPDQKQESEIFETGGIDETLVENNMIDFKGEKIEECKGEIITATLAELYFSQGFIEKSIEIYNKLLIQQPDQKKWAKRLLEIREIYNRIKMGSEVISDKIMHYEAGGEKEKILFTLEKWLENCRRLKKSN